MITKAAVVSGYLLSGAAIIAAVGSVIAGIVYAVRSHSSKKASQK